VMQCQAAHALRIMKIPVQQLSFQLPASVAVRSAGGVFTRAAAGAAVGWHTVRDLHIRKVCGSSN
jgi:hypothetical protein